MQDADHDHEECHCDIYAYLIGALTLTSGTLVMVDENEVFFTESTANGKPPRSAANTPTSSAGAENVMLAEVSA